MRYKYPNNLQERGPEMAFSWMVLFWVYAVNTVYTCTMFLAQHMDKHIAPRGSIIPGTNQTIMHIQDWNCMLWGDPIAVPLILNAFVQLAINGLVSFRQWVFLLLASNIISVWWLWAVQLSPNQRPDYGTYAIGKESWPGLIHTPYFGICVTIAILVAWNIANGKIRGMSLYLAITGAAIYLASQCVDVMQGHYAPLMRN